MLAAQASDPAVEFFQLVLEREDFACGAAEVGVAFPKFRAVNVGLFLTGYRVLTGPRVPLRDQLPGAVLAGCGWTALQALGGYVVAHQLRHASQVYGFFGVVLGVISWLYLLSQITLYAAELNAVRVQHLWPRSIVQPPLTKADQEALTAIARREERRPEEDVEVRFPSDSGITRSTPPSRGSRRGR